MSKGRGQRYASSNITITTVTHPKTPSSTIEAVVVDTLPHPIKNSLSASSPVQIPRQSGRISTPRDKHNGYHRRSRHLKNPIHTPDPVPPSVAALLAMTDIPRHRRRSPSQKRTTETPMTVQAIVHQQQVSEKAFSLSLTVASPLDVLLSPPDDDLASEDEHLSTCESPNSNHPLRHAVSTDSVPSLDGSYATTDALSSLDSASYFGSAHRRRSSRSRTRSPGCRSLEPLRSPTDVLSDDHPLSDQMDSDNADDYAYCTVALKPVQEPSLSVLAEPMRPLKAVFKSNLTASLRALRSAARTFSSINFATLPPDDVLSRSILAMDPSVPYTDERRPPLTGEMPSAELRRYLNPTTRPLEVQPKDGGPQRRRLASIQMQTYKVHRSSRLLPSSSRNHSPSAAAAAARMSSAATLPLTNSNNTNNNNRNNRSSNKNSYNNDVENSDVSTTNASKSSSSSGGGGAMGPKTTTPLMPAMRQREMRENPDFIRIAVMETAMRRCGKLDDRKPGRARWALPPRKTPINNRWRDQETASNGVPIRWIPINYDDEE